MTVATPDIRRAGRPYIGYLFMHIHYRADRGEVIRPFGIGQAQVDASVAHGYAKVVMPICTMNAIIAIVVHNVRHVWQVITRTRHGR